MELLLELKRLNEAVRSPTFVHDFNVDEFSFTDIKYALENGGYILDPSDEYYRTVKYVGYHVGPQGFPHQFRVGYRYEDAEDEDKPYIIANVFVGLARDGKFAADFGDVYKENLTYDEMVKELQ